MDFWDNQQKENKSRIVSKIKAELLLAMVHLTAQVQFFLNAFLCIIETFLDSVVINWVLK